MGKRCKFCGQPYSGPPVFPSSWGWIRIEAHSHSSDDLIGSRFYCSEKCRAEAEGKNNGGRDESESASEPSSSDSEPILSSGCSAVLCKILTVVGLLIGLIIVLGVIFGKNENANDPAVIMKKWHEHLEKRRAAFAEGMTEEGVEARGYKSYTWDEWQALRQKDQKSGETLTSEKTDNVKAIKENPTET